MVKASYTRQYKQGLKARLRVVSIWSIGVFALLCLVSFHESLGLRARLVGPKSGSIRKKAIALDLTSNSDLSPELTPEQRACQSIPESTEAFIQDVRQDLESISLKEWKSIDGEWRFPHLDSALLSSAFGNKKAAFVGDSTLFYMLENLNSLLNTTNASIVGTWSDNSMGLQDFFMSKNLDAMQTGSHLGFQELARDPNWVASAGNGHIMKYNNGTEVMWTGFRGENKDLSCRMNELVWPNVLKQKPQIIVANWGLHLMHHGDANPKALCQVDQFLHYEQWLQDVLNLAKAVGSKVVLFKTTNLVCTEKQPTLYQEGIAPLKNDTQRFLDNCVQTMTKFQSHPEDPRNAAMIPPDDSVGYSFTSKELYRFCEGAVAGEASAQGLNDRMRQFVAKAKQDPLNKDLKIEVFNDHDLESCDYSPDGFHFFLPQIPRIRLLAQMIKCLWEDEGEIEQEHEPVPKKVAP